MRAPAPTERQPLLTARETAARLSVSVATLYRISKRGLLPAVRLHPAGPLRFRPEDVDALIENGRDAA
jgi:excisionase family DNA binding protein